VATANHPATLDLPALQPSKCTLDRTVSLSCANNSFPAILDIFANHDPTGRYTVSNGYEYVLQQLDSIFDQLIDPTTQKELHDQSQNILIDRWEDWVRLIAGFEHLADWHRQVWNWAWDIKLHQAGKDMVVVAGRGSGKSTVAENVACALGARGARKYILYVRATQDQANASIMNIAGILESDKLARFYPMMGEKRVGKFGQAKGWNRTMVRTASGINYVGFGLDSALRGTKIDDYRPDLFVFDDIDSTGDTPKTTQKKIETITKTVLPAGSRDAVALGIQNLILKDGVFAKLANGTADFLTNRITIGPIPAVHNLEYKLTENGPVILSGIPTWSGQDLLICEQQMRKWGLTAFLAEAQHQVDMIQGGMFDHLEFTRIPYDELPELEYVACWIDPAVTSHKASHCQAIQIDGIGLDEQGQRKIYRLFSWEGVKAPNEIIAQALREATMFNADVVGCESNQGGDLWRSTFDSIAKEMLDAGEIEYIPKFASVRAGADTGGKEERAQRMLSDYERGRIVHVEGTHSALERALRRFPKGPPDDLVDAAYWSWKDMQEHMQSKRQVRHIRVPMSAFTGRGNKTTGERRNIGHRLGLRRKALR